MTTTEILGMSLSDKLTEAMRRSLAHVPNEMQFALTSMLRPESIALIGGTLVAWAGSHAFGVGEIVDVALLGVGAITWGISMFEGAEAFYDFLDNASRARTEPELEKAAKCFARAAIIMGMATLQTILLLGRTTSAAARGHPKVFPRETLGPPPSPGNELRFSRPVQLRGGALGTTDVYGSIRVSRSQSITEQRVTLLHELVHRYFSPRTGPFRRMRAEARMSLYARSALLRYLEEALAEGYAQLKVHGLTQALAAYRFPLVGGYVSVSQLSAEAQSIGSITLGGTLFHVSISSGPIPESP